MHASTLTLDQAAIAARVQWNTTPCGWGPYLDAYEYGSLAFFEEIARQRYEVSDPWMLRQIPFASARGARVLEIGFGMGTDLVSFARQGASVYGVDLSEEHHRLTRQNLSCRGLSAALMQADAGHLPLRSQSFDLVYSHGVLHHARDTQGCITEAYRVLKPGGRLILTVYHRYSAFHIGSVLAYRGIILGQLRRLGYDGLLATIEYGANGTSIKPLVKTFSKATIRCMLEQFVDVRVTVAHFRREHLPLGRLLPRFLEHHLEPYLGWYVVAFAIK